MKRTNGKQVSQKVTIKKVNIKIGSFSSFT